MRYVALEPVERTFFEIKAVVDKVSLVGNLATEELYKEIYVATIDNIKSINNVLFSYSVLKDYQFDGVKTYAEFYSILVGWTKLIEGVIEKRKKHNVNVDFEFYSLMDMVCYVDESLIIERTKEKLLSNSAEYIQKYEEYYQTYSYFWGNLNVAENDYSVIEDRVGTLCNRYKEFIEFYEMLCDYRSKKVLLNTLYNWITFDYKYLVDMLEGNFADYYDLDILQCDENEVLVDIGAYIGDSAFDFIDNYGKYKKIYCYEMVEGTVETMRENLRPFKNIDIRCKGVGSHPDVMYMNGAKNDSGSILSDSGSARVEIVAIDDDIPEPVTMIKMDIEGAEKEALKGCKNHILMDKPKLLICVYHSNTDILDIPKLINSMRDDYKFYLRTNGRQYGPSETVLFAL